MNNHLFPGHRFSTSPKREKHKAPIDPPGTFSHSAFRGGLLLEAALEVLTDAALELPSTSRCDLVSCVLLCFYKQPLFLNGTLEVGFVGFRGVDNLQTRALARNTNCLSAQRPMAKRQPYLARATSEG